MQLLYRYLLSVSLGAVFAVAATSAEPTSRISELDSLWAEVSRSVKAGDFDGYAATCHPSGVLVSEKRQTSYPLSKALAGWKQGFLDTQSGKMKATVEFRFSRRLGDETTSHETGIFRYATVDAEGKSSVALIHFTALLVKSEGRWQVFMEHQKSEATDEEWKALKAGAEQLKP